MPLTGTGAVAEVTVPPAKVDEEWKDEQTRAEAVANPTGQHFGSISWNVRSSDVGFADKRKDHYNMKAAMQRAKELLAQEEDDES